MTSKPRKPPQYSLKWLLALPVAVGTVSLLYASGIASELLFLLLAVPVIIAVWLLFCRLATHFLSDLID